MWVRARALAMHTLCALGSFAICSAFWGALSDITSLSFALSVAAACMAAGLLLAKPFPLRMGETQEVTPAAPWEKLFVVDEPDPEAGPVAVEIGYRMQEVEAELLPVIYIAGPNYHPAWNNRLGGEHPDAIISSIWGSREVELTFIKK